MYKHGKNLKIIDPQSTFISDDAVIGDNVTIYERNRIDGGCVIGDGCTLLPGNYLKDTRIGRDTVFNSSQAEGAEVGDGVTVGPYARLRPGAMIGDRARIGNFVEIKNAKIGEETKVSHLAYVGDAEVGRRCNIGCGAIFVNYNGKFKNRATVGDNCFIGSNSNIIAPVNIAGNTYITAGATVTEDLCDGDFVIGRARQTVKSGRAYEYLKERF